MLNRESGFINRIMSAERHRLDKRSLSLSISMEKRYTIAIIVALIAEI